LTITGSIFLTNSAAIWGGAAYSIGPARLIGGRYQANRAVIDPDAQGGALYVSNTLSISGSTFISNTAHVEGGGAYAMLTATLINAQFIGNTSQSAGAGGLMAARHLIMTNSQFLSNTSAYEGGGSIVQETILDSGSLFRNNTSQTQKGGGVFLNGVGTFSHTSFISNSAQYDGGAIYATYLFDSSTTADVYLINSQIIHNSSWAGSGGGVYSDLPLETINTQFISNTSQINGGGLWVRAPVLLRETDLISNTALGQGGGLYADRLFIVLANSTQIEGGRFERNTSLGGGGGAFISQTAALTNVVFISNTGSGAFPYGGGGMYVYGAATIRGGLFENNRNLTAFGGGLFAANTLSLNGTHFISNSTLSDGGGALIAGSASISNTRFERNTSLADVGGGLYISLAARVTATQFISNSAPSYGGGLYSSSGPVDVRDSLFRNNRSLTEYGGGLYAGGSVGVTGTQFISNLARGGGGLYQRGAGAFANGRVINSLFVHNTAIISGAAIMIANSKNTVILYSTIADYALNPQAAVVIVSGTVGITDTIITSHSIAISRTGGIVFEDYNLFYTDPITRAGSISGGGHDVSGDPKFVDPVHDNFHILTGSAAIDKAIGVGIPIDFDNQARPFGGGFDIGYDEYVILKVYLPLVLKNN
jgi:predicted outer membrane repeat protein